MVAGQPAQPAGGKGVLFNMEGKMGLETSPEKGEVRGGGSSFRFVPSSTGSGNGEPMQQMNWVYTCACACVCVYECVCVLLCMLVCMYMCVYMCLCNCMCVYECVCIWVCSCVYACVCMCGVYIYVCICVCL